MTARRILIVEDEEDIAHLLEMHLAGSGFDVTLAFDGHDGMRQAFARDWDLVILDVRLPGPDGFSICEALRRNHNYVPVLMLTSKTSELDRVYGLNLGADDYVSKPFSVLELVARVRAIFRRLESIERSDPQCEDLLTAGKLRIDPGTRDVMIGDRPVTLTAREFDLLLHFARHPGLVFSRASLLDSVWGYGHDGYEHTVNSHINRLRSKIEPDPSKPVYIVTVWGVGYKFSAQVASPDYARPVKNPSVTAPSG